MDQQIQKVASYIAYRVYAPTPTSGWRSDPFREQREDMRNAVIQLLNILSLNAGVTVCVYFLSTSLSLMSILITGTSSYFIYNMIRKIYIDIRRNRTFSAAQATEEFDKTIGLLVQSAQKK